MPPMWETGLCSAANFWLEQEKSALNAKAEVRGDSWTEKVLCEDCSAVATDDQRGRRLDGVVGPLVSTGWILTVWGKKPQAIPSPVSSLGVSFGVVSVRSMTNGLVLPRVFMYQTTTTLLRRKARRWRRSVYSNFSRSALIWPTTLRMNLFSSASTALQPLPMFSVQE